MTTSLPGVRGAAVVALSTGALLTVSALTAPAQAAPAPASAPAPAPAVTGKGAFLLNNASGATVYGKGADTRRQMASTTKIMTAAVVLSTKGVDLDRKVTVKQAYRDYVTKQGASTADLRTGDKVTVRQLLYATLLPSGCDAAFALADTFGTGKTTAARTNSFISQMNKKAAALGLKHTAFDSFDGISKAGNNVTTPRDLARIARYAMKNSQFRTVVRAASYKGTAASAKGGKRTYTWYNTNQLLGSYKGAIGIKTGTGTKAGPCLVFAATRGGRTLVGVILNGSSRYKDAAKMLDYGFGVKPSATSSASTLKLVPLPSGSQRD